MKAKTNKTKGIEELNIYIQKRKIKKNNKEYKKNKYMRKPMKTQLSEKYPTWNSVLKYGCEKAYYIPGIICSESRIFANNYFVSIIRYITA